MPADLKTGIFLTAYTTWFHNSLPIALFFGAFFSAFLMVIKPKRRLVFFLLGFILFQKAVPFLLWAAGWDLIFLGILT